MAPALADSAPDWLELALKRPVPASAEKASRVVYLDEGMIDVTKSGMRWRVREAVKILTVEGQRSFAFMAPQRIGQDFKLVGGWKVRPDGDVRRYDAKAIEEVDADGSYEFSMTKVKVFSPDEARVGDVIAWEYTTNAKSEAYQTIWPLGWSSPTLLSRLAVKVPSGWKISAITRNHPEIPAAKDDGGYTVWEARDLSAQKSEPLGIPLREAVPTLLVRWAPPETEGDVRRFDTWESVGRWYAGIVAPQVVADAQIRRTATEATAGTASKLEAIRGIARFVQSVRYLDTAVGRSTAEPHPAPQILKNRFGDCEDKAVLTITLLREIGIEAFPMLALTSGEGTVAPEFPAPGFFNHAIVAVRVSPDGEGVPPAGIEAQSMGRLVIFDPTSSNTGFGDLPDYLQGTRALLADSTHGALISLPVLPPEASLRETEARISFPNRGGIDVRTINRFSGQYAADLRTHYEALRGDKRKEEFLSWLSGHFGKGEMRGFDVTGVETPDQPIVRTIDFWMPLPGKDLGTVRMMAASLHLFTRADRLNETERVTPLRIGAGYMESDRTTIEIPAGWKILEPLPSAEASSPAGSYSMKGRLEGATLLVERTLKVNAITVPPSGYMPIKKFFDEVLKGDATGIAMEKTGT
jgi:hypothetical protein